MAVLQIENAAQLARRLGGVDDRTVLRWIKAERSPSATYMRRLIRLFGPPPDHNGPDLGPVSPQDEPEGVSGYRDTKDSFEVARRATPEQMLRQQQQAVAAFRRALEAEELYDQSLIRCLKVMADEFRRLGHRQAAIELMAEVAAIYEVLYDRKPPPRLRP